ncbi:hypothetical protein [Microbulbifer sp. JMSA008]|uniref:hypothetical protein n=1 Tax=Microbulbifer sp. JMSA008 TaxID=3243373 RepID=UPI004039B5DF
MRDKFGGATLALAGFLLSMLTIIDSIDGSFTYASKMNGIIEITLAHGAMDFFFSLFGQVFIGLAVAILGLGIYFKPKF